MVLVDTSVWIDHFRSLNRKLTELLAADLAAMHPMVLLELTCGTPPERAQTLHDLGSLPSVSQASLAEAGAFIERERLYGLGCGLVDLALLTSTLITPGARLWTRDQRLGRLAERFKVAYRCA